MRTKCAAFLASVGAIALAVSAGVPGRAGRSEPPQLVYDAPRLLDIRVCDASDEHGVTTMDQPDHCILSGCPLSQVIAMGYNVSPARVRGVDDARDKKVGVELAGAFPSDRRTRLMADAACAAVGCKATVKNEPGEILSISFGAKRPAPSVVAQPTSAQKPHSLRMNGASLQSLASTLEYASGRYFVADTRDITQYDFIIELPKGVDWKDDAAIAAIEEQTGLKITRRKADVPFVEITWPD